MSKGNANLSSSRFEVSDSIKMPKQTCFTNKTSSNVIESRNIHVENDFRFRNWCTSQKNKSSTYFTINNSYQTSNFLNDTINPNDSSSSDNILDVDNTPQNFVRKDQSAIR